MPDIAASLSDAVLTKKCGTCCKNLPVTAFYKNAAKIDGLDHQCKECKKNYQKANPIIIQTNLMVRGARNRAKKKHLEFNIDHKHVRSLVVSHCPMLGIFLEWSCWRGNGQGGLPNSPSLDRIDPTKGYIKGNVWIVSNKANMIKNNATHEELKLVTRAVGEALVRSLEF
jgi:hypothetical protein